MRIEEVSARVFKTTTRRHADTAGHAHPGPAHQVEMAILTIRTDTGDEGHCFSPPQIVREHVLDKFVRKVLIGADPFDREKLWQELAHWQRGSAGAADRPDAGDRRLRALGPRRAGARSCRCTS